MMVLYSPDWTNTGFSFILLTVNPFRHSTLTEHGLYIYALTKNNLANQWSIHCYVTSLHTYLSDIQCICKSSKPIYIYSFWIKVRSYSLSCHKFGKPQDIIYSEATSSDI